MTVYKRFSIQSKQPQDLGDRTMRFRASTSTVDRSGDVIVQEGWKLDAFASNPVFLAMHNKEKLPVGRVISHEVDKDGLVVDVQFMDPDDFEHPSEEVRFADTVYQMYKQGFLNAVSVGFIPLEAEPLEETGGRRFVEQELYEISAVTVPDNAEALALRSLNEEQAALLKAWATEAKAWSDSILNNETKQMDEDAKQEVMGMLESTQAHLDQAQEALDAMFDLMGLADEDEPDEEPEAEEEDDGMDVEEDGADEATSKEAPEEDEMDETEEAESEDDKELALEVGSAVLVEGEYGVIQELHDDGEKARDPIAVIRLSDGSDVEAPVRSLIPTDKEVEAEADDEAKESKPYSGPDDPALEDVPGVAELDEDARAMWVAVFNDTINEDESNESEAIRAAWAAVNQEEARQKYLESQLFEIDFDDLRPAESSTMYELEFE